MAVTTSPDLTTPKAVKVALYATGLIGILGTWGRTAADSSLIHLLKAIHGGQDYILPGSKYPLKTSFTGIYWPVDYLLDVLVVFFWEAVDGSHPTASAIGIYFLGQLFPIAVVLYLAHLREGAGASLIRPTLWALAFQLCAIASVGWIWALLFLSSSTITSRAINREGLKRVSLANPRAVLFVPFALVSAYIIPAIAMGLPSPHVVSNDFQQWALVLWNIFPLPAFVFMKALDAIVPKSPAIRPSTQQSEKGVSSPISHRQHLTAVRWASVTTLAISFTAHAAVWGVSLSSVLFPAIYNPEFSRSFSPDAIFIPPISIEQGATVGDGLRSFFLWDQLAGYSVTAAVVLTQLRNVMRVTGFMEFSWIRAIIVTTILSCIVGPGSACLIGNWIQDEILFGR